MDAYIVLIVLTTACLHAGWNAKIKALDLEPFSKATLFTVAQAVIAAPLVAIAGFPASPSWPYLAVSTLFSTPYLILLMHAYQFGPVSLVYPLVRGSAVLLTAIASLVLSTTVSHAFVTVEALSLLGLLGILSLAGGLVLLSWPRHGEATPYKRKTLAFSAITASCLSLGLITDGLGARVSNNVVGYVAATYVLLAVSTPIVAMMAVGPRAVMTAQPHWKTGLLSGLMAVLSYIVAVWAMSIAPIPKVVALRETSVLIAIYLGSKLGERIPLYRLAAAILVCAGIALIRLH